MIITKADKYMVEMIHRIREQGYKDINPRPKYADGTPAHTISVNHTFRTYDLSKGEFPIVLLDLLLGKPVLKKFLLSTKSPQMILLKCITWA